MIVKSKGRKRPTYFQLLSYILKQEEAEPVPEHLIMRHNVLSNDIYDMDREYRQNEANRRYKKKTGLNRVYHEWISLSNKDKDKVTDEMLIVLSKEYIRLRNTNALIVSAIHKDKAHYHIHFCISATEINGKSIRIPKYKFNQLKKDLQHYQIQQYPELQNSIIDFDQKSKSQISDKEYHVIKRKGKSQKQNLKEEITKVYNSEIMTHDEFIKKLEKKYTIYKRGKHYGITADNGRNYRLSTLGFDDSMFQGLKDRKENLDNLQEMRKFKSRLKGKSIYFESEHFFKE